MTLTNKPNTDDLRIKEIKELVPPAHVFREFPVGVRAAQTTYDARQGIHRILHGADDRLLVVVGPCSIHDVDTAIEYARKLQKEIGRYANELLIVMRVYFEKPRTTVGWKGLINDPRLDGSFRINEGVRLARGLLLELNDLGVPCATEFLDTITPQYTADLIATIDAKVKPVYAFTDSLMASAAYNLGVSARKVVIGKMAEVGSVGVLVVHREASRMLEASGITTTVIRSGK